MIKEAVSRLHPDKIQERIFRCRRASFLNLHNEYLPQHLQTKPHEVRDRDYRFNLSQSKHLQGCTLPRASD